MRRWKSEPPSLHLFASVCTNVALIWPQSIQALDEFDPTSGLYVPAGQPSHTSAVADPMLSLKVPVGQPSHDGAPAEGGW